MGGYIEECVLPSFTFNWVLFDAGLMVDLGSNVTGLTSKPHHLLIRIVTVKPIYQQPNFLFYLKKTRINNQ